MGRTPAQNGRRLSRLRAAVAFLLVLVFGLQAVPLVQAQAKTPDCCMASDGKACSMHLHRAAKAEQPGHGIAALQPRCPCTPMVPAAGAHDALSITSSKLLFALALQRAVSVQPRSLRSALALRSSGTRGPPSVMLSA